MFPIIIFFAVITVGCANVLPNDYPFWNTRIVGGVPVPIEDFPYQVSLQSYDQHFCGGSILDENHIITAGHCATGLNYNKASVRAGSNLTFTGGSKHSIVWVKIHEDFKYTSFGKVNNDIALAKVHPPFKFDNTRSPIPLYYAKKDIENGQMSVLSGYGRTSEGGSRGSILMAVEVPVVSRNRCVEIYAQHGSFFKLSDDIVCAGTSKGGKDSCQGDSGGPMVVDGQLAGIVSFGFGCGRPGIPGVYTNIAYFIEWIAKNIE